MEKDVSRETGKQLVVRDCVDGILRRLWIGEIILWQEQVLIKVRVLRWGLGKGLRGLGFGGGV